MMRLKFININKKLVTYIVGVGFFFFWGAVIEEQQKTAYLDLNNNKSVPVHLYNLNGSDSKLHSKKQFIYENEV